MKFVTIENEVKVTTRFKIDNEDKNIIDEVIDIESPILLALTRMYIIGLDSQCEFLEDIKIPFCGGELLLDPYNLVFEKDNERYLITNPQQLVSCFVQREDIPNLTMEDDNCSYTIIDSVKWRLCVDCKSLTDDEAFNIYYWISDKGELFNFSFEEDGKLTRMVNSLYYLSADIEEELRTKLENVAIDYLTAI